MSQALRVLLVEDSPDDAQLIMLQLEEAELKAEYQRVDTEAAFNAALASTPDLILSDFAMPQFNGLRALRILKESGLDIPFILISGTVGEDVAVDAIKQGADDYLMKDRLARLGSSVQHALEQKRLRTERKLADRALRESEERFRGIFQTAAVSIWEEDFSEVEEALVQLRMQGVTDFRRYLAEHPDFAQRAVQMVKVLDVNDTTLKIYGAKDKAELLGSLEKLVAPDHFHGELIAFAEGKNFFEKETFDRTLDGKPINLWLTMTFYQNAAGHYKALVCLIDVTARKQAQEALRESERQLKESQGIAGLGTYTLDLATGNWRSSEVLDRLLGIETTFPRKQNDWAGLIHTDDRQLVIDYLTHEVIAKRSRFDKEFRIVRQNDQAVRWVHTLGALEFDEQTQPVRLLGTVVDITERKQAEENLRTAEAKYRTLVEHISAITYTALFDEAKTRVYVSPQIETLLGFTQAEYLNDSNLWKKMLYPDDQERVLAEASHFYETGQPLISEYRSIARDGRVLWFHDEAIIYTDETSRMQFIQGVKIDITARKHIEESLEQAETKYRTLVEQLPIIVYVNPAGDINSTTYVSPQIKAFLGFTQEEWLEDPKFWSKALHVQDRQSVLEEVQRIDQSGAPFDMEYRIIAADGRVIWIHDQAKLLRNPDGLPLLWQGLMVDISERKQAEESLSLSKAQLLANLEITPNVAIQWYDKDGHVLYWNPASESMYGWKSLDAIGKTLAQLIHTEEEQEEFMRILAEVQETGRPFGPYEARIRRRDGTRGWVLATTFSIPMNDEQIGFVCMDVDITERKQAEQVQIALYEIANVAQTTISLDDIFISIHQTLKTLMPAENFYIAIYDAQDELLSFPYFVDELEAAPPPQKLAKGLTEYVLQTRQPLLATPQVFEKMVRSGEVDAVGADSVDWIGVPLTAADETFGVIVVQTYTDKIRLTQNDLELLTFVSTQAAMVIKRKQVEESLLQFRQVMDESNDAIYFIDPETSRYLDFNKNATEFLGYDKDELSQLGVIDVAQHVNSMEVWRERVDLISKSNGIVFQSTYRRKNGTLFPVEVSARMLDYHGKPIMVAVVRDITERKQAEEALQESQQLFSTVFQSSPTAIVLSRLTDARFVQVNEGFLNLTGYELEDVLGLTSTEAGITSDPAGQEERFARLKQDGRLPPFETEVRTKSGEVRSGLTTVGIVTSRNKQFALSTFIDITERKQAEEKLQERTSQLEAVREIGLALTSQLDVDKLLHSITSHALGLLHCTGGGVYLHRPQDQKLEWVVAIGTQISPLGTTLERGEGLSGKVWEQGKPIIVDDYEHWEGRSPNFEGRPFKSVMGVPIVKGGEFLGVLVLLADQPGSFDMQAADLLELFAGYAAVAIQNARLFEETRRRAEEFAGLYQTTLELAIQQDLSTVLAIITKQATTLFNVPNTSITLYDPVCADLELAASIGPDLPIGTRRKIGEGLAGLVAQTRAPIIVEDYQRWDHRSPLYAAIPYAAMMGVPLLYHGNLLGVLDLSEIAPSTRTFNEADVRLLSLFAGQAASAIANAQLFEDLKKSNFEIMSAYDTTMEGWSRAMDLRDHETEGHTLRVTDLTLKLARAMHLSESELTHIRRGSLLHDIGKMGIPDTILLKEGELTEEEWVVMRTHPQLAYDMLSSIEYLHEALDIPSNHHEKWDGTGYPRGLKGEEIPLAARIFAVVDVWDAICSDRIYRKGWSKKEAIKYIKSQSGIHFEPRIVEIFLKLLRKS